MEPKEIYIGTETPIGVWASENKETIMKALYDNVFDFVDSDDLNRCVLRVISQPKTHTAAKQLKRTGISIDFIITRDDINDTIDRLIGHLVEVEEYEKCAELIKLKNKD
jgi:hypothetical protein